MARSRPRSPFELPHPGDARLFLERTIADALRDRIQKSYVERMHDQARRRGMTRRNPDGSGTSVLMGTVTLDDMMRYLIPFYNMQTGQTMTGRQATDRAMPAIRRGEVESWPESARTPQGEHPSEPYGREAHKRIEMDVMGKAMGGANPFGSHPLERLLLGKWFPQ